MKTIQDWADRAKRAAGRSRRRPRGGRACALRRTTQAEDAGDPAATPLRAGCACARHLRADARIPLRQASPQVCRDAERARRGHRPRRPAARGDRSRDRGRRGPEGHLQQCGAGMEPRFYWRSLKPGGGGQPTGELGRRITSAFGGFDTFKRVFSEAAVKQFGSGWAWLVTGRRGAQGQVDRRCRAAVDERARFRS